jgi:UDP-N-acetylmuramate dehydrogenase
LLQQNISLKPYNTFGIDAKASYFATFSNVNQLKELINKAKELNKEILILGGGSNILLTKDVDTVVLKNELYGMHLLQEDESSYLVQCAAGEVWHTFVQYTIANNYQGLENLSLIPGTTGAAPMQNIGAYGVEIKDVFFELEALNIQTGIIEKFNKAQCEFGYRESVFKKQLKGKYIITSVTFRLNKEPKYNTSYGAIQEILTAKNIIHATAKDISTAVIAIRESKLPNPKQIGNAGSFFKNPEISTEQYMQLKEQYNAIPGYVINDKVIKVPAGWLIEQANYKGLSKGKYGVHTKQALVLVNYGGALGKDIYNLSTEIIVTIQKKFNITLEREVNVW